MEARKDGSRPSDQTVVNIRERAGRRKQKPVRGLYLPSERVRYLFGIWVRLGRTRGLEGRYWLVLRSYRYSSNRLLGGIRGHSCLTQITFLLVRGITFTVDCL